jgi:hypothetical protein
MFSTNLYTRRRQQKATALFVASGVIAAIGISKALRTPSPSATLTKQAFSVDSFGTITVSPDQQWQAELRADSTVVVRQRQNLEPRAIATVANSKGIRFSPDSTALLVHTLQLLPQKGAQVRKLEDHLLVLEPATGKRKTDQAYTLTH